MAAAMIVRVGERPFTAVLAFAMSLMLGGCSQTTSAAAPKTENVTIAGETFTLELALNDEARERGMKGRTEIADHGGMLFVFPDSRVAVQEFWMHECLCDMDIIYLDRLGRVTAVHRMKMQPPKRANESEDQYKARLREHLYSSGYPAQFAIELKAGSLDRLKIKVEDKIALEIPRLKGMAR